MKQRGSRARQHSKRYVLPAAVVGVLTRVGVASVAAERAAVYGRSGKIFDKGSVEAVPRKVREVLADYYALGFSLVSKQGKGSHRKLRHPLLPDSYTVSGQEGDDVEYYQEKQLRQARAALGKARKRKP